MGAVSIRQIVEEVVGTAGDATVLDYLVSCLELEDNDFGSDGEEAYEGFGSMLVRVWQPLRSHADQTSPRTISVHAGQALLPTASVCSVQIRIFCIALSNNPPLPQLASCSVSSDHGWPSILTVQCVNPSNPAILSPCVGGCGMRA